MRNECHFCKTAVFIKVVRFNPKICPKKRRISLKHCRFTKLTVAEHDRCTTGMDRVRELKLAKIVEHMNIVERANKSSTM